MPRRRRMFSVGQPCHCVNRGQDGRILFAEDEHFQHFIDLMEEGKRRYPVRIYAYCLVSNHFHLLISQRVDKALSAYMQWVQGRYGFNLRYDDLSVGQGHVFQRRFWSEAIGFGPFHFINVQRYIEANPVAAGLVKRAEDWKWSSLWERETRERSLLDASPLILPDDWLDQVNRPRIFAEDSRPEGFVPEGSDPSPIEVSDGKGSDPSILLRVRRRRGRRRVLLPEIE
jgi:putative transposase